MKIKTEFQAYGNGSNQCADNPQQAAAAFFAQNPKARKCNIIEGKTDGHFFTVAYGRKSTGDWPRSYKDVTRKTVWSAEGTPAEGEQHE
jgi:hypothetical protein